MDYEIIDDYEIENDWKYRLGKYCHKFKNVHWTYVSYYNKHNIFIDDKKSYYILMPYMVRQFEKSEYIPNSFIQMQGSKTYKGCFIKKHFLNTKYSDVWIAAKLSLFEKLQETCINIVYYIKDRGIF